MSVVVETTIGDITIDLFTEERPIACLNFLKLCKVKYYNYNLFHTIEQGFIAQAGDPTGVGDGGSSIWGVVEGHHKRFFEAESLPKIYHTNVGLLSLVGAGKHLVGSQFFFTLGENLSSLDGQHCVIGTVVEGHEVLRQINEAIVDENFRPYQDIRITHTVILDDPFPDPRGFREPSRSPSPSTERLKNGRIAADEDIDDTEGKSLEEIQEMLAEREAKARATILEIVGDLPDAEMAPPENVLFVCKLNPVTTDDDLEIIFSRFGKVKSCEVIRDRKTGDSLQYAFVEFEQQSSCEAAFFKMDNVLIDDRRIHVDFSQSVSKVKWSGKGRGVEGDSKGLDFNNLKDKNEMGSKHTRRESTHFRSQKRTRTSSAERQKSREERHREQERQSSKSHSKNRYDMEERNRYYNKAEDRRKHRKNSTSPRQFEEKERNTRHDNKEDICYLKKKNYDRYADKRSHDKYDSEKKNNRYSAQQNDGHISPRKKANSTQEYNKKLDAKKHNKKFKKQSHEKSSNDETSSDSDSSSECCGTSSSNDSENCFKKRHKKKSSKNKRYKLKKRKYMK